MPRLFPPHPAAIAAALAITLAGSAASAQVLAPSVFIGIDTDTPNFQNFQVFDVTANAFAAAVPGQNLRPMGLAYDQMTRTMYIIGRGNPTPLYSLDMTNPTATRVQIGTLGPSGSSSSLANAAGGGLAWDGANGRLIAVSNGRVFATNGISGTNTEIRTALSGVSFKGADIDPVTRQLYLVNTGTATNGPIVGGGVYRMDFPYTDGSRIVKLAPLPLRAGVPDTEVESITVGAGYIWLSGERTDSLYRISLSDLTYGANVAIPVTATGSSAGSSFIGSVTAGPDLGVMLRNDAETTIPTPGEQSFVVSVRNVGSATATAATVSVPVPAGVAFVSATNGAILDSGAVTLAPGDLAPGQGVEFNVTFSSGAAYTATATAATTAPDVYAGNNTASLSSQAGAPNLALSITPPGNCSVAAGDPATYTFLVANAGQRAAEAVLSIPIPQDAVYQSSSIPGSVVNGVLGLNIPSIAAGATASITVVVTPPPGLYGPLSGSVATPGDSDLTNNAASTNPVLPSIPVARYPALLSSSGSNNTVPGLSAPLATGVSGTLDSSRSLNARWGTFHWRTTVTGQVDAHLRIDFQNSTASVVMQEGVTTLPGGFTPLLSTSFTPFVNDAGDFVFSGRDNRSDTLTDGYVVKNVAGTYIQVARESGAVPAPSLSGALYGSFSTAGFSNAGKASFIASSLTGGPITSATDQAFLADDGLTVLAQKGVTTPAGMSTVLTSLLTTGNYVSADGTRYILSANSSVTGGFRTAVVVGTVGQNNPTALLTSSSTPALQTFTLPGFSSPATAVNVSLMMPDGRWVVRGSNADGEDWVVSGTGDSLSAANIIARTGTVASPLPLFPGSTENWDAGASTVTNLAASAYNPRGDFVIVGKSLSDTRSDIVFVYNNLAIIAREGDPIDADNDGQFDDDAFLAAIDVDDKLVMTNDAVYAMVRYRNRQGVCDNTSTMVGTALVRIPLPAAGSVVCCRGSTCDVVPGPDCTIAPGSQAGGFISSGITCNTPTNPRQPCCKADYNKIGNVELLDIFAFLGDWFTNRPYADFNGASGVDLLDIFAFLTAWFAGPCT